KTNEVFVADGYNNRRVIVFDADTGVFKRQWGAYGEKPEDNAPRTRVYEGQGPPSVQPSAWNSNFKRRVGLCCRSSEQPSPSVHARRPVREGRFYRAENFVKRRHRV